MNSRAYTHTLSSYLQQFIDWSGRTTSWLVLAMVLITFCVVVLRYAFDTGWIALQESVSYLHSMVFLLGASYTLKHDSHVRVDIFYSKLSEVGKARVDLLGHLLILLPVMAFIIWISLPYVQDAWQVHEGSREAGGLPGIYLLKSLIILMAAMLMIQGVAMVMESILTLSRGARQSENKQGENGATD